MTKGNTENMTEKRARASASEEHAFDQARAVEELMRGSDLMAKLRALLTLASMEEQLAVTAGAILDELSRSYAVALSILQLERRPEFSTNVSDTQVGSPFSGEHKRRKLQQKWTIITSAPYDDGHQWRKYGEKMIRRAKFSRSYYRCTHKDGQGCPAMKQVQQKDSENDPVYLVTYRNQHICKEIPISTPQDVVESSPKEPCLLNFELDNNEITQVPQLLSSSATENLESNRYAIQCKTEACLPVDNFPSPDLTLPEFVGMKTMPLSSDVWGTDCFMMDRMKFGGTFEVGSWESF